MRLSVLAVGIGFVLSLMTVPGPASAQNFYHSEFDRILKKHVNNRGEVNYKQLIAQDLETFQAYLESLATADLSGMGKKERLAFWINAYNANVIQGVASRYPLKSVMDYPEFFKEEVYKVAGKTYSLDQIEHQVIRPVFGDARVHFVLVCAAKGCPILQNSAFTTANVEDKLERGAKTFLNDKSRNYVDRNAETVYLSQIFDWFASDFEEHAGTVLAFVKKYMDYPDKDELKMFEIKYLTYDWKLNSQ